MSGNNIHFKRKWKIIMVISWRKVTTTTKSNLKTNWKNCKIIFDRFPELICPVMTCLPPDQVTISKIWSTTTFLNNRQTFFTSRPAQWRAAKKYKPVIHKESFIINLLKKKTHNVLPLEETIIFSCDWKLMRCFVISRLGDRIICYLNLMCFADFRELVLLKTWKIGSVNII